MRKLLTILTALLVGPFFAKGAESATGRNLIPAGAVYVNVPSIGGPGYQVPGTVPGQQYFAIVTNTANGNEITDPSFALNLFAPGGLFIAPADGVIAANGDATLLGQPVQEQVYTVPPVIMVVSNAYARAGTFFSGLTNTGPVRLYTNGSSGSALTMTLDDFYLLQWGTFRGGANSRWNPAHSGEAELEVSSGGSIGILAGVDAQGIATIQLGSVGSSHELIGLWPDVSPGSPDYAQLGWPTNWGPSKTFIMQSGYYSNNTVFTPITAMRSETLDTSGTTEIRFYNPCTYIVNHTNPPTAGTEQLAIAKTLVRVDNALTVGQEMLVMANGNSNYIGWNGGPLITPSGSSGTFNFQTGAGALGFLVAQALTATNITINGNAQLYQYPVSSQGTTYQMTTNDSGKWFNNLGHAAAGTNAIFLPNSPVFAGFQATFSVETNTLGFYIIATNNAKIRMNGGQVSAANGYVETATTFANGDIRSYDGTNYVFNATTNVWVIH